MSRLHSATYVIPTRRSFVHRLTRRIELAWCRWRLRCLMDEYQGYMDSGFPVGPLYIINCELQANELRQRIAVLEIHS